MSDPAPQGINPHQDRAFLNVLEEAKRSAEESLERMRPLIEGVLGVHRRMNKLVVTTFRNPLHAFHETMAPTLRRLAESQKAFTSIATSAVRRDETFTITQRAFRSFPSYPSVTEIADAVYEKFIRRNQAYPPALQPSAAEPVVPTSAGLRWEELDLRFKNPHTLAVHHRDKFIGDFDYTFLGFARKNTKERKPDKQWAFLSQLSVAAAYSRSFTPTPESLAAPLQTTKGGCEKIKAHLAKKLQAAFGIPDDPFYPYDPETGYRPRFALKPIPDLRNDGELHASGVELIERITSKDPNDDF